MRRRIVICLALLLALCVLGDVIAMLSLKRSIAELSALAESHRIQIQRANLTSSAVQIEADLMAYGAGHRHDGHQHQESIQRFRQALHACGECHHSPAAQAQLDQVHEVFHTCAAAVDELLSSPDGQAAFTLDHEAHLVAHELTRQATALADQAMHSVSMQGTRATGSIQHAWTTMIGTLIAALLVGGIIALHLQRHLTRPVNSLLKGIGLIRDGQTDHRFSLDGDEEFRALGTALNQAYDSMARAQENVLQAEKMAAVGKMAAGIAHEVGNPLASISAVAQTMQRNSTGGEQAEDLDLIMQHVGRASRVVRGLLAFSRPAQDEQTRRVDISELLDKARDLLKYDKRVKHASLETQYQPGLIMQRGDADRLILVFTNIMINAFDAMSTHGGGDGRLTIKATREGDSIIARFADNGPGMTQEQTENAFDPFFTTKDPGTGTGLGLWVCRQVVQKHRGTIHIDSAAGGGTTVTVTLPVNGADQPAGDRRERS